MAHVGPLGSCMVLVNGCTQTHTCNALLCSILPCFSSGKNSTRKKCLTHAAKDNFVKSGNDRYLESCRQLVETSHTSQRFQRKKYHPLCEKTSVHRCSETWQRPAVLQRDLIWSTQLSKPCRPKMGRSRSTDLRDQGCRLLIWSVQLKDLKALFKRKWPWRS